MHAIITLAKSSVLNLYYQPKIKIEISFINSLNEFSII